MCLNELLPTHGAPFFAIGALVYYFCIVQAIEQLRGAKFYSHKHWTSTSLNQRTRTTTA